MPRGSFVTSVKQLSDDLKLTINKVRTALSNLEKTGEITRQTTNKYTVVSVVNYELYQSNNNQTTNGSQTDSNQATDRPQTDHNQTTTIEKGNKGKREEKKNAPLKSPGGFVPPTKDEVKDYVMSVGSRIDPEEFMAFYESKGWMVGKNKMKSWKSAIVTWEKRAGLKRIPPEKKQRSPRKEDEPAEELAGDDWMNYGPGWRERDV